MVVPAAPRPVEAASHPRPPRGARRPCLWGRPSPPPLEPPRPPPPLLPYPSQGSVRPPPSHPQSRSPPPRPRRGRPLSRRCLGRGLLLPLLLLAHLGPLRPTTGPSWRTGLRASMAGTTTPSHRPHPRHALSSPRRPLLQATALPSCRGLPACLTSCPPPPAVRGLRLRGNPAEDQGLLPPLTAAIPARAPRVVLPAAPPAPLGPLL